MTYLSCIRRSRVKQVAERRAMARGRAEPGERGERDSGRAERERARKKKTCRHSGTGENGKKREREGGAPGATSLSLS